MDAFFQWLSSSMIATAILVFSFGIFVVIFTVAFFQGREISFWPPKIGPKQSNTDKNKNQKSNKPERYLKFEWSSDIVVDRDRLARASTIDWMAISNYKTLREFKEEVAKCLEGEDKRKNGGQIRLLLVNPKSEVPNILAELGHKFRDAEIITQDIDRTMRQVAEWHQTILNCNLQVRYIIGQPPYRLMIVNRNLDTGYIRLRWGTTPDASQVPTVVFTKKDDPDTLDFFGFIVEQFDEYWNMAQIVEIDDYLKQEQTG